MKTKICPLLQSDIPSETFCKGAKCAFAVESRKTKWDAEKQQFVSGDKYHYCLIRDFMLSFVRRE